MAQLRVPVKFAVPFMVTYDEFPMIETDADQTVAALKTSVVTRLHDLFPAEAAGADVAAEFKGGRQPADKYSAAKFMEGGGEIYVKERTLGSRTLMDKISMERHTRTMILSAVKQEFEEIGTSATLALSDVWKAAADKAFRKALFDQFRLPENAEVFVAFKIIVADDCTKEQKKKAKKNSEGGQFFEEIMCSLNNFLSSNDPDRRLSDADHAIYSEQIRGVLDLVAKDLFDDRLSGSEMLEQGVALANFRMIRIREAHPYTRNLPRVLDLLAKYIRVGGSGCEGFQGLALEAVNVARASPLAKQISVLPTPRSQLSKPSASSSSDGSALNV
jgi:hypothetical protein